MFMKIFRRTAALMLGAAMVFSTGCSEKTTMTSQRKQVEIEFSWWGNDARNRYTLKAVELFEELHPEIRVKCSYSEWSGYETRNKIWIASDTEADVMQINYGWLTDYSADGTGYYDLNSLSKYIKLSNFSDEQLSYGTRNGVLNALPIAMNSETVYINKTIYDRYGVDVPKTWDDLFRAADAMRSANIYPLSASSKSISASMRTWRRRGSASRSESSTSRRRRRRWSSRPRALPRSARSKATPTRTNGGSTWPSAWRETRP